MSQALCDLHCHLLWGLDDGPRAREGSLEMARILVELGFETVGPSPHAGAGHAPRELALERLAEAQDELDRAGLPLRLLPNAENHLLDDGFWANLGSPASRCLGAGKFVLVEAPYSAPLPALEELIFRIKLKGATPLIAHPERCLEFERKGRAADAVRAGACLQLDVGSLVLHYGPVARKLARSFLDEGLYAVAATDMHSPDDAEWLKKALRELRSRVGEQAYAELLCDRPERIAKGEVEP